MIKNTISPQRVVITGAGNISSLGNEWSQVREEFLSLKNAVKTMPEWDQYPTLKLDLLRQSKILNYQSIIVQRRDVVWGESRKWQFWPRNMRYQMQVF